MKDKKKNFNKFKKIIIRQFYYKGTLIVANRKKSSILTELREKKYDPCPPKVERNVTDAIVEDLDEAARNANASDDSEEEASDEQLKENERDFDYLLSLPIWSLTMERVRRLKKERDSKGLELEALVKTDIKEMWRSDLQNLETSLDEFYVEQAAAEVEGNNN